MGDASTNDAPWYSDFISYNIMAVKLRYMDEKSLFEQTLLGGSAQHCKEAIFNDCISMAALMEAFFPKTQNFMFWKEKPPLKPPLIYWHWKWIVCSDISLGLRGFDNIQIIFVCRRIFLSKFRYFLVKMVENLYFFGLITNKCYFLTRILKIWLRDPQGWKLCFVP